MENQFLVMKTFRINDNVYNENTFSEGDLPISIKTFLSNWFNLTDSLLVNTSGSTGKPKKILLKKAAMKKSAEQTISFFNISKNDELLLCLPINFIAGKMMIVRAIESNANLIVKLPELNPLLNFSKKISFAAFTPQQVYHILKNQSSKEFFSTINTVIIGGGEISDELETKLQQFSNSIYSTYGMTETITHVAVRKIGASNKIYKVFKGIKIGLDHRNCLTLKANYLENNLIITNDVVEIEGTQEFKWLGRYDNLINSGGLKFYPEVLENKIQGIIPNQFYFIGKPDKELGNKIVLVVEGEQLDATTLKLFRNSMSDLLEKHEMPKEIVFVKKLERTETGKIRRCLL